MSDDAAKLRELLPELALGTLAPEQRAEVEAMLRKSPDAQRELRMIEDALGELAMVLEPVQPSPEVRERVLASIAGTSRFEDFAAAVARLFDVTLARARELLALIDEPSSWVPGPASSQLIHFEAGAACAGADCGFVRVDAGERFPRHRHVGEERVLILYGTAHTSDGETYVRGQEYVSQPDTAHAFHVPAGGPALVFAVRVHGIEIES